MQIEMFKEKTSLLPDQVSQVQFGKPFIDIASSRVLIRVKPTSFLLNSSIVQDVINRGDVFVCCLELGTVYPIPGNRAIKLVDAAVVVKGVIK